jgi:hypothetical protein
LHGFASPALPSLNAVAAGDFMEEADSEVAVALVSEAVDSAVARIEAWRPQGRAWVALMEDPAVTPTAIAIARTVIRDTEARVGAVQIV